MYPIERHARILSLVVFLQAGGSPGYRRRMFSRVLRPRRRAARTAAFWQRRRLHQARLAPVHGKAPRGGYQVPGASARGRGSAIVQGATTNDRVFHCRSVGGEFGGGGMPRGVMIKRRGCRILATSLTHHLTAENRLGPYSNHYKK